MQQVNIIGGGLAGCEAAYQLAKRGVKVTIWEQKPSNHSPAHHNDNLAEIVCSNSLKSTDLSTASGLLKAELEILDCKLLQIANTCKVPAGSALAVDRDKFSTMVTDYIKDNPNITVKYGEVTTLDSFKNTPTIIATGPLTSDSLAKNISELLGEHSRLYFYDASSPIVTADSLDYNRIFAAGRYNASNSDYLNCTLTKDEYYTFVDELISAERVELKEFEQVNVFEACMPVEIMASRGRDSLRFGPLKSVGLVDSDGRRPYAVVQLRKENTAADTYNLVGFQTNLTWGEQKRVFSLIPALKNAEFVKYGVMHRNTYICAPKYIDKNFCLKATPNFYIAGQLAGVEGYVESIASGLVAAISLYNKMQNLPAPDFGKYTIIGSLCNYISAASDVNFQPMNANFGLLPELEVKIKDKKERKLAYSKRGIESMHQAVKNYKI